MRRFLISSTVFNGQAELTYDQHGTLAKIDISNCNMTLTIINSFKSKTPAHVHEIETAFKGTSAIIVEADFIVTLEDFKREYPYQRNMHLLPPIWDKMDKTDKILAWQEAIEYRKYCERNANWYKPKIAAGWLKEKQYLNKWKAL